VAAGGPEAARPAAARPAGGWGRGAAGPRGRGAAGPRGGVPVGVTSTGREPGGCDTNRTPCLVGADGKADG
jgi:hypothetical protein